MPVELEAKMKLADPPALSQRLDELGSRFIGNYFETNIFFDTKSRTLLSADQGLRLRISQDTQTGQTHCVITHKGPNAPSKLKNRQETELVVENADNATKLLECLGFSPMLRFQKRRSSWKLEDCSIELDEVPHLGHYIEIEGPNEERIMQVRQLLGLATEPLIKTSYVALLRKYLQERQMPSSKIEFA